MYKYAFTKKLRLEFCIENFMPEVELDVNSNEKSSFIDESMVFEFK